MLRLFVLVALVSPSFACQNSFTARQDFSLEADWNNYENVRVESRNGSIALELGTDRKVSITGTKTAAGASDAEAQQNVAQLEIVAEPDATSASTLVVRLVVPAPLEHRRVGASMRLVVPQAVAGEVRTSNGGIEVSKMRSAKLRSSNGSIQVSDIQNDVELRTSNGAVSATRVGGALVADSSNGNISVREIGGNCTLESSNGRIEMEETRGSVWANTSNAAIRLAARPRSGDKLVLDTSNGNVHITIPEDLSGSVALRTSNGKISTRLGKAVVQQQQSSKSTYSAELNQGGPAQLSATTSNGAITLECTPSSGEVRSAADHPSQ